MAVKRGKKSAQAQSTTWRQGRGYIYRKEIERLRCLCHGTFPHDSFIILGPGNEPTKDKEEMGKAKDR